jgi:tetratricopeptide (TPR) repeat protein
VTTRPSDSDQSAVADDPFRQAQGWLQSGRAADAERFARSTVERFPDNDRAWRLLGDALRQTGRSAEAADAWRRSVNLNSAPDLEFELGKLCNELGRFVDAERYLRRAVDSRDGWFHALTQLGIALGSSGRSSEAIEAFDQALRVKPNMSQAHHNLGVAFVQAGRPQDGIAALENALRLQPNYPEANYNLGNALATVGRKTDAVAHFRSALAQRPDYPEAYHNLGLHLTELGRPEEAIPYLRQAMRLRPDAADGPNNLGIALEALGRFDEAEAAYSEALRRDPKYADAHSNLGNCCKARGRLDEALACYEIALWLRPQSPSTSFNRSLALLQRGDWTEGWKEYEWRLRKGTGSSRCPSSRPIWDGSAGNGRTILLWAEQGLGDAIQFSRYAFLVQNLGFRVVLHIPHILMQLFRSLGGVDEWVVEGVPPPAHDVHCPLMGLPHRFATTLDTVPATVSYLSPDPDRAGKWAKRLANDTRPSIGLYWQGNPHHPWDRHRSMPLRELAILNKAAAYNLIALQQGPGRDQLRGANETGITDLGREFESVDDLAAVVSQVDLVVTVDTLAAHLAGALGKPTWLLLSTMCDWRWMTGRSDTPWYPNTRIFRQMRLGDWQELVTRIATELPRWTARKHKPIQDFLAPP